MLKTGVWVRWSMGPLEKAGLKIVLLKYGWFTVLVSGVQHSDSLLL